MEFQCNRDLLQYIMENQKRFSVTTEKFDSSDDSAIAADIVAHLKNKFMFGKIAMFYFKVHTDGSHQLIGMRIRNDNDFSEIPVNYPKYCLYVVFDIGYGQMLIIKMVMKHLFDEDTDYKTYIVSKNRRWSTQVRLLAEERAYNHCVG